jgi:methylthioribose-1-phosphate isomerase
MSAVRTIFREGVTVSLIDQTRLPSEIVNVACTSSNAVCTAIRGMQIRGAPALGIAAAYAMALAAEEAPDSAEAFAAHLHQAAQEVRATRPTAVNLFWGVDQALAVAKDVESRGVDATREALWTLADRLLDADVEINRRMGDHGVPLIPEGANVLTHCNAGALATGGWGTALGVIRSARAAGTRLHVYVDETRPFLQGARLTAWELQQEGIPFTVITDNMAGYFMARGEIDLCIVGADRIAASGDVANKIGTYSVAVLADAHSVPFYVAAPISTIDLSIETGAEIPIEERDPAEVTAFAGRQVAPFGSPARHPAFDVTPNRYVSAIVTEVGVLRAPFDRSLADAVAAAGRQVTPRS